MRSGIPRVDLSAGGAVKQQRSRHIPLDVPPGAPVLATAKNRLTPKPDEPRVPVGSARSRASFTQSVETGQRQEPQPPSELSLCAQRRSGALVGRLPHGALHLEPASATTTTSEKGQRVS